jgi:hypothetical protein
VKVDLAQVRGPGDDRGGRHRPQAGDHADEEREDDRHRWRAWFVIP